MTQGFLASIVARKRAEVAAARAAPVRETIRSRPPCDFKAALARPGLSVIAEIKRRSPSKGVLRAGLDAAEIARQYERAEAAAISCLTDREFFGANEDDLPRVAAAVAIPILRKEFIIDESQIPASHSLGADAVLLIARILSATQLADYIGLCRQSGLAALVEVHSELELETALAAGADIVGINNRDLDTFSVSLATSLRLRPRIPTGVVAVAESGIASQADVAALERAGFDAVLLGETLVTADDPGARLAELLGRTNTLADE